MRKSTLEAFVKYPVLFSVIGIVILFWALGDDDWLLQERLALGILGLGLIVGGGFSEALLHDPADCDVFPFRLLARIGFLLAGTGFGIAGAMMEGEVEPVVGVMMASLIVVPVGISLVRLIWTHRKKE